MYEVQRLGWFCIIAFLTAASQARAADQSLIDAAKAEGSVTWYTTGIVDPLVRPVAQAFEKTYGIHVDYIRNESSQIEMRIFNEAKAGHVQGDVFDGTTTAAVIKRAGLAMQWLPENAARLPKQDVDAEGYWVATNLYVLAPSFNTDLIPKGTEPRTYEDLLSPKLKDKIIWPYSPGATSGALGFIGLVLADIGDARGLTYLTKLATQGIVSAGVGARQVLDQVISGEYAMALQSYNDQVASSAAKGAPIAWHPIDPAMSVPSVVGLTKDSPHPNAAKLLVDFLVSDEGQMIFRNANYITVAPNVPPLDPSLRPDGIKWRAINFTPEQAVAAMPHWTEIYNQLFR
jgi:ABC-type Fe3+ transport system substrate-binding protein